MSESEVDLSQIRGDWKFHMDYVQNAVEQTLKRQLKYHQQLGADDDAEIGVAVGRQAGLWNDLKANANDQGTIPTDSRLEQFISACREAKISCDAYQDSDDRLVVEEFAEACRQIRALCDDLEMMLGQSPDNH